MSIVGIPDDVPIAFAGDVFRIFQCVGSVLVPVANFGSVSLTHPVPYPVTDFEVSEYVTTLLKFVPGSVHVPVKMQFFHS
jgi:hypothetical protein